MIGSLQNEDLFHSMFQLTAEGVLVLDNDATILLANPACKNLFGIDSDTLLGKNLEFLITKNNREQLITHLLNFKKTRTNKNLEILGINQKGIEFSLEMRLSSAVINGKNLIIIFLRDVTNRTENILKIKQAKDKLLESNKKFDTLINNIKGILFRCDNNRHYSMHYISEGCLEITGYTFEDFKNKTTNYGQLILEADRHSLWEHIQTSIRLKKPFSYEYRIKHKTGSIKYVWEKGEAVYDSKNKIIALEGFIIDITAQKETEIQLRHYEAKTKALLEAMPDMMFIQDRNGDYIDFYSNYPQKELWPFDKCIGSNMKDVLPKTVYKKVKQSHKNAIASGVLQIVDYSIKRKKRINHYEARVVIMNNHSILTIVRDVTKEKARDAQLNVKNNALSSASNSIIISDAQSPGLPIIYCNSAFEKITGYKKEEIYGKNCNFLQGDDRDQKEINIMKNAIKKGESCHVVLRNYKKDRTLFWNDVTITPVHNKDNILTHYIGVQCDVTKMVEEGQLKNQTQKILELIAKDKPLKSIIREVIGTTETHLKNSFGSVLLLDKVTKKLYTLVAPNLPNSFTKFINGVTIGPKVSSCGSAAFYKKEIIIEDIEHNSFLEDYKKTTLKNGIKSCWSYPIMSSKNEVLGTFTIYTKSKRKPLDKEKEIISDMTYLASVAIEKQQDTKALKESKKELEHYAQKLEEKVQERTQELMATVQKLVESNLNLEDQILITKHAKDDAISSKSLTTAIAKNFPKGFIAVINKNLKLVLVEGEAIDQLRLRPLFFEGMTLHDISGFAEERKTRIKVDISKTLSGQHLSFEVEYKNRYFSVNTAPLFDENNEISYALMVYNDISEQKEIEFKIQNSLKKERELNELKSRFVSMASHEFRTPLSAILTSAILIYKQKELGKEEKLEKYVLQIENNVNHLTTILNDFLSLSKLEEGKIVAIKEHFDIVHLFRNLINENKLNLKRGQKIHFYELVETLIVNLDAKLLRHIITNLLSNASKYSEENTHIDFVISQDNDRILIQITDQGIGIAMAEQKHLFERFFRAKNANNIEGTGLGLNIAKHYTELMGGSIGCKSELNMGSTFWVELPIEV